MITKRLLLLHSINEKPSRYAISPATAHLLCSRNPVSISFDDGYKSIYPFLATCNSLQAANCIVFLVPKFAGGVNAWDSCGELASQPLMSWDEIKELSKNGVQFGSHTLSHVDLTKVNDQVLAAELGDSRKQIEDMLGKKVTALAYPFGYFNQKVIDAAKEAGYTWAATTSDSLWEGIGNPFRTRRIEIKGSDSSLMVRAKISGLYDLKGVWELPGLCIEKLYTQTPKSRHEQ